MTSFDDVAVDVLAGAGGRGAVKFEGWLGPWADESNDAGALAAAASAAGADAVAAAQALAAGPKSAQLTADDAQAREAATALSAAAGRVRLFTDWQFMEWLEIPVEAILHHVARPNADDGKSFVWIKREARITRGQAGCAYQFAELEARDVTDDPTATRPRPYGGG